MFAVRSYMLDISRDKVPTMGTLKQLVEILEKFNYNQLQLYTEHTFAYSKHEAVWKDASPMTAQEVRELDLFCAMHGIDLVPNQNSFGHLERWLVKPEYNHLAELPHGGAPLPWGGFKKDPTTLCPTDPASLEFLAGLRSAPRTPRRSSFSRASTTNCCRTSSRASSTSAATRRSTSWARDAARPP